MNYQPLLRNYQQMVRIIRDKENSATSYQLGNAFGTPTKSFSNVFSNNGVTPTELQIRTLDEINVPSVSLRRPGATSNGGVLSSRECSTLFFDLNESSKQYISALGGSNGLSRSDGNPGTKYRTQLGLNAIANKVHNNVSSFNISNELKNQDTIGDKMRKNRTQSSKETSSHSAPSLSDSTKNSHSSYSAFN